MGTTTSTPPPAPAPESEDKGIQIFNQAMAQQNPAAAIPLLESAALLGHHKAQAELGRLYLEPEDAPLNPEKAIHHLKAAIEHHIPSAYFLLGKLHFEGQGGLTKSSAEAYKLFSLGAEAGDDDCKAYIGWMMISGDGMEKNIEKGVALLREAESTSKQALYYIGYGHMEGIGFSGNYKIAFDYFTRSSAQGYTPAKVVLASLYMDGKGVTKSLWEAVKLYTQAAEKGHAEAQCHLGMMYRDGMGVKTNPKLAKSWIEKSALQGNALAEYCLAEMALKDMEDMGTQDETQWLEVVELFLKASSNGQSQKPNPSAHIRGLERAMSVHELSN